VGFAGNGLLLKYDCPAMKIRAIAL
jgi:hypothetical protein